MIKRSPVFSVNEPTDLDKSMAQWIFDSHYWIENGAGYYQCEWCGKVHTHYSMITKNDELCNGNVKIVELKNDKKD